MGPLELQAVRQTVTNALTTLRGAGYAGTAEQLREAMEMLISEIQSQKEFPASTTHMSPQ